MGRKGCKLTLEVKYLSDLFLNNGKKSSDIARRLQGLQSTIDSILKKYRRQAGQIGDVEISRMPSLVNDLMAEAQSTTTVIREASFLVKKKTYKVTLTDTELVWEQENSKKQEQKSVRVCDIIVAKSQALTKGGANCSQWTVLYVSQQKNFILKRVEVTFTGDTEACESFCKQVQETISAAVSGRPRKLLVLINPISGRSKGRQVYTSKVAPIFAEANIETDVIITERAHHSEEIIQSYELKSVDGIVIVSGDGMYHEVGNGLVRRMATETGGDVNDPGYAPPEFPLPIGLIPCGTGNGIAKGATGSYNMESAAWTIVLGYTTKYNLFSVFSDGKLVAFSNLLTGYVMWGDIILAAENRRSQGIMRYPIAMAETMLFKAYRQVSLTVSYKCTPDVDERNSEMLKEYVAPSVSFSDNSNTKESENKSVNTDNNGQGDDTKPGQIETDGIMAENMSGEEITNKEDVNKTGQTDDERNVTVEAQGPSNVESQPTGKDDTIKGAAETLNQENGMKSFTGTFIAVMSFASVDIDPFVQTQYFEMQKKNTNAPVMFTKPCTKMAMLKFMHKFLVDTGNVVSNPTVGVSLLANEWKIVLNHHSDPDSDHGRKELIMNIDGETTVLKKPEYYVRLFPERIPIFCNHPSITGRTTAKT